MKEFQRKHKIRKRVYSKPAVIILLVILALFSRGVFKIYQKEKDSRTEVERLTKQRTEIENRLASVTKNSEFLKTEAGLEAAIRNKFDVVKEGEQVIVVVDKEIPPEPEEKKNFLEKFWGNVTGVFKKDDEDADVASTTEEESSKTEEKDW